jgi:hypothetical protein
MATNVPVITWSNGAPVLPSIPSILSGVQADINTAFGGGVNPSLTTPQGQLAQSETAIISDKNSQIAYIANMLNPATAQGIWQDAIGFLYFISRIQAAGTVVAATCVGAVGTVIPVGSVAQDTSGYLYSSTAAATIPAGGSVTVQFQCQTTGPISCAIGALSKIYTAISGWNTITNAAAGAVGTNVESRAAFEARRQLSVAGNAVNSVQSIQAAVLQVTNVIDCYVVDNPTNSAISYGSTSYSLPANSVCVSVSGGTAAAVAAAIWSKKSLGCSYAGNTSQTVQDTSYNTPYPTYTVTWLTPTATPVYFAVQLKNISALPNNIVQLVQAAIIAAFNGTDGGARARINQVTYAGRYYAGLAAIDPNVEVLSVLMGFSSGTATNAALTFGIDQLPTISASQIAVTLV